MTLAELRVGQKAVVDKLEGDSAIIQRLMEMGLLEGQIVELLGVAPLGDPLEIRLGSYRLSLRKSEAARILVTPLRD
ncbi:MAG: ferrous iron transport protein A [Gemmatales bacterium]|nr:ferrous iron transport protein A [Gemmatales bacterium]MDW8388018.1 ferrous iron transport protein A [Gemmatales bacterium]